MRKSIRASLFAALLGGLALSASPALAATYTVDTLSNTPGSIGYDPSKPAPTVTPQGFYAAGSANGGSNGDYASVRFTPDAIGLSGLTPGQITGVSYTAQNAVAGSLDWRVKVYTVAPSGATSWYGYRIEAKTTTSGTAPTEHANILYDRITNGSNQNGENYYTDVNGNPPQAFLNSLAIANDQKILFFDIIAGANTGGYDYDTFINNITISSQLGSATIVAATPEPASLAAIGAGAFGLLRRRRRAV